MRPTHSNRPQVIGLLGIGLDNGDGHRRITRSETALLLGGSTETHERMQETAIRFEEALERRGKSLADAEVSEVVDLLREAHAAAGG
jgi:hypothetical protein